MALSPSWSWVRFAFLLKRRPTLIQAPLAPCGRNLRYPSPFKGRRVDGRSHIVSHPRNNLTFVSFATTCPPIEAFGSVNRRDRQTRPGRASVDVFKRLPFSRGSF